jgi:lipopolysaccharide transport system permease protein
MKILFPAPLPVLRIIVADTAAILRDFRRSWRVLWALTAIEVRRKYAGSILGLLWYPMYSGLLLASYCFLYLVVFQVRFKDFGNYDYVLFVFSGLVPFLGVSEAVTTSATSVRSNLSILRNAVFPIEFVPVRSVFAALFGLVTSLGILVLMALPTDHLGWHMFYLPVALLELVALCLIVGWVLAAVAVIIPDVIYLVNIAFMLLMFLSPVGYSLDMVPEQVRFLLLLNPLTYLVDAFRFAVLGVRDLSPWVDAAFLAGCLVAGPLAGSFFKRMSPIFADHE